MVLEKATVTLSTVRQDIFTLLTISKQHCAAFHISDGWLNNRNTSLYNIMGLHSTTAFRMISIASLEQFQLIITFTKWDLLKDCSIRRH